MSNITATTCSPVHSPCRKGRKPAAKPRAQRAPSASQIAKNAKDFETWSFHQHLETASYATDIPEEFKATCDQIFTTNARLPAAWGDKSSKEYNRLQCTSTVGFLEFLDIAHSQDSAIFGNPLDGSPWSPHDLARLQMDLTIVFAAWERLITLLDSGEKLSEADFVANVYNVFRSPAIRDSSYRVQKPICLPSPTVKFQFGPASARILTAKTAIPDCVVLIPSWDRKMQKLSSSSKSAFKVLKSHSAIVQKGDTSNQSSFRFQATPCEKLPDSSRFEFVSSVWEDKKPTHTLLADAYRQNRMSTAAVARHLHSLHIQAPVFGLLWEHGNVRAHVDWCSDLSKAKFSSSPVIYSAPYNTAGSCQDDFHAWQLQRPSDILKVFFLIRSIDAWTMDGFRDAVVKGVKDLYRSVRKDKDAYHPWRNTGNIRVEKENILTESVTATSYNTTASSQ